MWKKILMLVLSIWMVTCMSGVTRGGERVVVPPNTQVIVPLNEEGAFLQSDDPFVYTPTQSPGDTVGESYYDLTENGSMGRQVHYDSSCVSFTWMNLEGPSLGDERHIWYNGVDASGLWLGPVQAIVSDREGFSTISALTGAVNPGDMGKAVIAMHADPPGAPAGIFYTNVTIDLISCLGAFTGNYPDSAGNVDQIWPMIDIGQNDVIHVANEDYGVNGSGGKIGYVRSTDIGGTWDPYQIMWDSLPDPWSVSGVSPAIAASPVSGKVAVAWITGGFLEIYYKKSTDYGVTWSDTLRLTDFANPCPDEALDPTAGWVGLDILYDYNDVLHFAMSEIRVVNDTLRAWWGSQIVHYFENGRRSQIASGMADTVNPGCNFTAVSHPTLGTNPANGELFCTWTQFRDTSDVNPDRAANGLSNGEIYAARSCDGGFLWGPSVNLTNSESNGCTAGNCDDDRFSSIARIVNDTLHIAYLNSKDAGTAVIGAGSSTCPDVGNAQFTLDQILYLKIPASNLSCTPTNDTLCRAGGVGVEEGGTLPIYPTQFGLAQNSPNPFSSGTTIAFSLPRKSNLSLAVYDITGRIVKDLMNGEVEAGSYSTVWDGKDDSGNLVFSGIYFYRLISGDFTQTRKMVVLR